jgi:hypothetical protein
MVDGLGRGRRPFWCRIVRRRLARSPDDLLYDALARSQVFDGRIAEQESDDLSHHGRVVGLAARVSFPAAGELVQAADDSFVAESLFAFQRKDLK